MMSDIIITGDITEPEFDEDGHVYMVDGIRFRQLRRS